MKRKIQYVAVGLLVSVAGLCWAVTTRSKPNSASAQAVVSDNIVTQACASIYMGDFEQAGVLVSSVEPETLYGSEVEALKQIADEYGAITLEREAARHKAFEEQMEKLRKLEKGEPIELEDPVAVASVDQVDPNDPSGVKDPNEVTLLLTGLSVITRASEFASPAQKTTLMADPFVKETLQKAIDRAVDYEAQGKWLEAYTECYAWLKAIDPNDEVYTQYSEELWDKVVIASTFEDSPCETSKERFEGIVPEIFDRVVRTLNYYYVNNRIDYADMATKALQRCKLLTEVMTHRTIDPNDILEYDMPTSTQVAQWNGALDGLMSLVKGSNTGITVGSFLGLFEKVLEYNKDTIDLPASIVISQFAEASLATLDPHTTIIWPRRVQDFTKAMTNEFTGVGIEISKKNGLLTVASLLLDTPAYKAGLDAGDVIEVVDGLPTKDMSLNCAVKKITGPKGTEVKLAVRRAKDGKLKEMVITRDRIIVPTVRGWLRQEDGSWLHMIDPDRGIGYVRITSFSGETSDDFEKVLLDLEKQGLKGLVLDLRGNSGGLLSSAVSIVDMFVKKGLIVRTQPGEGGGMPDYKMAHAKGTHPDYPMVVLVDEMSASASEIVSGALADDKYERAVLVGQRTHGKGSVQVIVTDPEYQSQLKYTMAYYHLPSGQRVNSRSDMEKLGRKDWGVTPDVKITLRSDELRKLIDIQRDNAVLVQANHDKEDEAIKKHSADEVIQADAQLEAGMLVIKAKQIEAQVANTKFAMKGDIH
ncbi:MAG: S41 family peptidase [Phycisphaerae bacterium]|nr:S41 family peptidase [Phycisphaerae bacterium]